MISGFAAAITAGKNIKFVIDNVKMNYVVTASPNYGSGASIPLELYTVDGNFNKIESVTFYDWVSPVVPATAAASKGYTKIVSLNDV